MAHWWNGYPWRVIQPNFREIDTKDFNEEAFLASLKDFSCNAVMLNAAGPIASYPTALPDHSRSAYLDGFDLKRLVERCHENGVKVIARTDFSKIPVAVYERHPDWAYRKPDGEPLIYNGFVQTCLSGGYQGGYMDEILKEMFQKIPFDGIYCNMGTATGVIVDYSMNRHGPCQCEACRRAFKAQYGMDVPVELSRTDKASMVYFRFLQELAGAQKKRVTQLLREINPELAYAWGLIEGNSGLWLNRFDLWGTGLTQRRTPYNGRNYEYISEDPMLTNRIGYEILRGCVEKGIMNGPKHMGFNDQEHNRGGVSAYMTEQKFRETDLRGFQGGLSDANGLAVMIAFNRIGATNAAHHAGMLTKMLRDEWGYKGLISTDMMNNKYYFNAESMVMSGITQVADFAQNDNHINQGENGVDKTWAHISVDSVKNDSALVEKARENLKYQLYTFANSAVLNVRTERVNTWWDTAISTVKTVSLVCACLSCAAWLALTLISKKKEG